MSFWLSAGFDPRNSSVTVPDLACRELSHESTKNPESHNNIVLWPRRRAVLRVKSVAHCPAYCPQKVSARSASSELCNTNEEARCVFNGSDVPANWLSTSSLTCRGLKLRQTPEVLRWRQNIFGLRLSVMLSGAEIEIHPATKLLRGDDMEVTKTSGRIQKSNLIPSWIFLGLLTEPFQMPKAGLETSLLKATDPSCPEVPKLCQFQTLKNSALNWTFTFSLIRVSFSRLTSWL
jgi:hypothetical protein